MRTQFEREARIERSEINPLTSSSAVRRFETFLGMRTHFEREARIERSEINPLTSKSAEGSRKTHRG
jgi:hypothetical protein